MTQSRVNEIINRRREVSRPDVYERIADGLDMPDDARHLLGLAAAREKRSGGAAFDLSAFPEVVRVYASQGLRPRGDPATGPRPARARRSRRAGPWADRLERLAPAGLLPCEQGGRDLRVRVLLLDLKAPALARRAAEIDESEESLASGVRLAEARLRELAETCDIQVYRYGMLPIWRMIRTDNTMFVSAFDAGWEGHESATYKVMETPQGPLFRGFRRMVEALVDGAERTV